MHRDVRPSIFSHGITQLPLDGFSCNFIFEHFWKTLGSFTLHSGLKYEMIYHLDAIEYLFVFFQLDMFRAYTPIFRSYGCYNFFIYAAFGVLYVMK